MENHNERLKAAMEARGIRQSVLSYKTGISEASISHYLKGDYKPKAKNLKLIADALHVSEAWLDGYDVPMQGNADIKSEPQNPEDVIIYHRNGVTVKKRLTDDQMKMLIAMIEAVPDDNR